MYLVTPYRPLRRPPGDFLGVPLTLGRSCLMVLLESSPVGNAIPSLRRTAFLLVVRWSEGRSLCVGVHQAKFRMSNSI